MSQSFSERYPPRNRKRDTLPVLRIEVEDLRGIKVYDPISIIMTFSKGERRNLRPLARPNFQGVDSELSRGHAAVLYRSGDIELRLTPDELDRLVMYRLEPAEFFALAKQHGAFFEIHSDFYDEETGEALQPRGGSQC